MSVLFPRMPSYCEVTLYNAPAALRAMANPVASTSSQPYEQWHVRVWDAYSRYMEATARYRQILGEHQQRPIGSPDGACALTNAHQEESAAYCEYTRILRIFAELTQQKLPLEKQTQD